MADVVRTPRNYLIEIRGELGDQFCVLFAPMTLHRDVGTTVLTGPVRDQSQLLGLIGTIQELGCELVSFQQVTDPDLPPPATRPDIRSAPARPGA